MHVKEGEYYSCKKVCQYPKDRVNTNRGRYLSSQKQKGPHTRNNLKDHKQIDIKREDSAEQKKEADCYLYHLELFNFVD